VLALEKQQGQEMHDEVHLVDGLASLHKLGPGLLVAVHARVEVHTVLVLEAIQDGRLDHLCRNHLHRLQIFLNAEVRFDALLPSHYAISSGLITHAAYVRISEKMHILGKAQLRPQKEAEIKF
jgi:hypothetical protein